MSWSKAFKDIRNIHKQILFAVFTIGIASLSAGTAFATTTINSQPISPSFKGPGKIVFAGGSKWYLESASTGSDVYIGKMTAAGVTTDYNITALSGRAGMFLISIAAGPDGNIWFNGAASGYGSIFVGFLNTSTGTVTTYSSGLSTSSYPGPIIAGLDGNMYYYHKSNYPYNYTYLVKVNVSTGAMTNTVVSSYYYSSFESMTMSTSGSMWMTDTYIYQNRIIGVSIGGSSGSGNYLMPNASPTNRPNSIVASSDGNLWIRNSNDYEVLKMTPQGAFTTYPMPSGVHAGALVSGPDGTMWFLDGTNLVRITSAGSVIVKTLPTTGVLPASVGNLALGPNNQLWFSYVTHPTSSSTVYSLGSYDIYTAQTVSFTSTAPTNAVVGTKYAPTAVSTSGLPVAITVDSSAASVCSIVNGIVSFQGAGTCVLNANQGGDADYYPASQVQQSFEVSPVEGDVSVTLNCPSTASATDVVNCTITVTNNGPAVADSATLTALFSSSLTDASISGGGTISGQSISWSTPSLASGTSATFTFSATASAASKASVSASILQANPDSDISNNIADAKILIS